MLFSSYAPLPVSGLNIVKLEQELVVSAILYIPEWIRLRTNQFNEAVPVHLAQLYRFFPCHLRVHVFSSSFEVIRALILFCTM